MSQSAAWRIRNGRWRPGDWSVNGDLILLANAQMLGMAKFAVPLPVISDWEAIKSKTNIEILYGSTNGTQECLRVLRRRSFSAAALTHVNGTDGPAEVFRYILTPNPFRTSVAGEGEII